MAARHSVQHSVNASDKVRKDRAGVNRTHEDSLVLSATACMCKQDCPTASATGVKFKGRAQFKLVVLNVSSFGKLCRLLIPLCFHQHKDRAETAPHTAACQRRRHQWPWCGAHASAALEPSRRVADHQMPHLLSVSCKPHNDCSE